MRGIGPQAVAYLEAVHFGHHDIQQDQVRLQLRDPCQRFAVVAGEGQTVSLLEQEGFQGLPARRFVVHNQDGVLSLHVEARWEHPISGCFRVKTRSPPRFMAMIIGCAEAYSRKQAKPARKFSVPLLPLPWMISTASGFDQSGLLRPGSARTRQNPEARLECMSDHEFVAIRSLPVSTVQELAGSASVNSTA